MNHEAASENLQVIRTLMERAALYRLALAPIMTWAGAVGLLAAFGGLWLGIDSLRGFALYWMAVSLVVQAGGTLLVRRQAMKNSEPFWSAPARRVAEASMPPLFVGMMVGLFAASPWSGPMPGWWLPVIWMALYGCALHAGGAFASGGLRLFGWIILFSSSAIFAWLCGRPEPPATFWHGVMGLVFGGLHLAYGIYLYVTEQKANAA